VTRVVGAVGVVLLDSERGGGYSLGVNLVVEVDFTPFAQLIGWWGEVIVCNRCGASGSYGVHLLGFVVLIRAMSSRLAARGREVLVALFELDAHVDEVLFECHDLLFEFVDVVGGAEAGLAPGLLSEQGGQVGFELLGAGGDADAALLGASRSACREARRVCCVGGKQTRFSAVLPRSDGVGEFGEDRCESIPSIDIPAEFVVATTEVLHERVPSADHPCRAQPFQSAHRPQPGLQTPMIGFDGVIRILFGDVARGGYQLLDHSRVGRCPVGAHLGRA
jgi:hypothetical protein